MGVKAGPMGRTETPEVFNIIMEFALEKLVSSWRRRGFGFILDDDSDGSRTDAGGGASEAHQTLLRKGHQTNQQQQLL